MHSAQSSPSVLVTCSVRFVHHSANPRDAERDGAVAHFVAKLSQVGESETSAFAAIADGLERVRVAFDVQQLAIGFDHETLARQVCSAGRKPLGALEHLCFGPPRLATIPALALTPTQTRSIQNAVLSSFANSTNAVSPRSQGIFSLTTKSGERSRRNDLPLAIVVASVGGLGVIDLEQALSSLYPFLRAGELLEQMSSNEFAWILTGTTTHEIPAALARLVREGSLGKLVYGIAVASESGFDMQALLESASDRMHEARVLAYA